METRIDIAHIPFSCYGCMLSVSQTPNRNELIIHDVRQRCGPDKAFALYVVEKNFKTDSIKAREKNFEGKPFEASATPELLRIKAENGCAEICVIGDHRISIRAEGLTLLFVALTGYGYGIAKNAKNYEMFYVPERRYGFITCNKGSIEAQGPYLDWRTNRGVHPIDVAWNVKVTPENGKSDIEVEIGQTEVRQDPVRTPEDSKTLIKEEWNEFLSRMPAVPDKYASFARVTWYNLWSSYVRAQDVYKTDVMLMSKKTMTSVWTWDHCFNALSIAYADKKKALDQFFIPFWQQNESGVLLDMFNPGMEIVWGVTKPPIHGWCFSKLMDRFDLDTDTLITAYGFLEKWTNWWMNYRDEDGDGVPEYPQGCDSGWDNATIFDTVGRFVESADLSAFLILQMRCLSRIAGKLGNAANEKEWLERSNKLLDDMLRHCWNGKEFVPKINGKHTPIENTGCLLNYMPIVLGDILPKDIADKTVERMFRHNLTENGLATESVESDMYESDGYWRGPIWAPSTYLIVDGLNRLGRKTEAKDVAERFVKMCAEKAHGNYENFDAVSGKGLRAPGYTWTASVWICLLWEYCM